MSANRIEMQIEHLRLEIERLEKKLKGFKSANFEQYIGKFFIEQEKYEYNETKLIHIYEINGVSVDGCFECITSTINTDQFVGIDSLAEYDAEYIINNCTEISEDVYITIRGHIFAIDKGVKVIERKIEEVVEIASQHIKSKV